MAIERTYGKKMMSLRERSENPKYGATYQFNIQDQISNHSIIRNETFHDYSI